MHNSRLDQNMWMHRYNTYPELWCWHKSISHCKMVVSPSAFHRCGNCRRMRRGREKSGGKFREKIYHFGKRENLHIRSNISKWKINFKGKKTSYKRAWYQPDYTSLSLSLTSHSSHTWKYWQGNPNTEVPPSFPRDNGIPRLNGAHNLFSKH